MNREPKHRRTSLSLRELEPLPRLRTAGLLALDRTRIAREQAEVAKLAPVGLIDDEERAGSRETQRTGLTRHPTTFHLRLHVVAAERVGRAERLLDRRDERRAREVVAEGAAVHFPLPRARGDLPAGLSSNELLLLVVIESLRQSPADVLQKLHPSVFLSFSGLANPVKRFYRAIGRNSN